MVDPRSATRSVRRLLAMAFVVMGACGTDSGTLAAEEVTPAEDTVVDTSAVEDSVTDTLPVADDLAVADADIACDPAPTPPPGRPLYHFTPPSAWMNDPAGLSFLAGEYHLYYQRDPNEVFLGDVRWGHAVSPDLVHWSDLPDALSRDATLGVPFTGSAVVDSGDTSGLCGGTAECLVAIFTHANGADGAQKQSVAVSVDHGRSFTPYAQNPVLPAIGEPDFRDPAVRWFAPTKQWVMAVGAMDRVLFYTSPNLLTWTASGSFVLPEAAPHGAVECPNLFPLPAPDGDSVWVLEVGVTPGFLQAAATRYWLGSFDGATFTAGSPPEGFPFDGPDFYAAQVFSNVPGERTVWLGWMSQWSYAMMTPTVGYRGAQSIPRSLSIVSTSSGMRLAQQPVAELRTLEWPCALLTAASLTVDGSLPLLAGPRDALVIRASLEPAAATTLALAVLDSGDEHTRVGYDAAKGVVFLDRTQSGDVAFAPDFPGRYDVPIALEDGRLDLTIYVDRTSVEVFAGNGTAVITAAIYPTSTALERPRLGLPVLGLSAVSEGGAGVIHDLDVRAMKPSVRAD